MDTPMGEGTYLSVSALCTKPTADVESFADLRNRLFKSRGCQQREMEGGLSNIRNEERSKVVCQNKISS